MDVTAPGKLIALTAVIVGCFAVIIVGVFRDAGAEVIAPIVGVLTLVVGYLIGNGTGARQGHVSVPPFQPKPLRQVELLTRVLEEDLPFKERERVERLIARTREVEADG